MIEPRRPFDAGVKASPNDEESVMTLHEPNRSEEPEVIDNAVHVPDPEANRAGGTQIAIVAVAIVVILSIFFYGVNNQRTEVAAPQTASTGATPVNPGASPPAAQAPSDQKPQQQGNTAQTQQPPTPGNAPSMTTGQGDSTRTTGTESGHNPANQQPANAGQDGSAAGNSGAPAQPGGQQQ
jgi:hypothetical protein